MNYIVHKRFKGEAICGSVNLPAKTECTASEDIIFYQNQPICFAKSENAHQYFARNDDGLGMERGSLTQSIQKKLAKKDKHHQDRWDKIWDDSVSALYRRKDYDDYWLWDHSFFSAYIEDLKHIANLIGA